MLFLHPKGEKLENKTLKVNILIIKLHYPSDIKAFSLIL